jgi:hypothetical protein
MNWLNQLPGFQRCPAGFEHRIWRRLPTLFVWGALLPILLALLNRATRVDVSPLAEKAALQWDFLMVGLVVTNWMILIALGVGCFIVRVMKGPAYVADAYPLPELEPQSLTTGAALRAER